MVTCLRTRNADHTAATAESAQETFEHALDVCFETCKMMHVEAGNNTRMDAWTVRDTCVHVVYIRKFWH